MATYEEFEMNRRLCGVNASEILRCARLYDGKDSEIIKDLIFKKLDREEKQVEAYIDNCEDEKTRRRIENVFYIDDTESDLKKVLDKIPDRDLEMEIDEAISDIARVYECLGFVMGYLMHRSGI